MAQCNGSGDEINRLAGILQRKEEVKDKDSGGYGEK